VPGRQLAFLFSIISGIPILPSRTIGSLAGLSLIMSPPSCAAPDLPA
jgi:hypothetical protein